LGPEADWSWLHTIAKRIDAAAQPRSKAANLRMSDELYQLGFDLMDEAAEAAPEAKKVRTKDAITYRDGLIIALLAADPVRRSNFAALTLERHSGAIGRSMDDRPLRGGDKGRASPRVSCASEGW
jgi:integrase/recombinase XerD